MVIEDKTLNVCVCVHAQSCPTLCDTLDGSLPGSFVHGIFPGKSTGVGCHLLLQRIFLIQGSNLGLPHCRQMLYHVSHQGSPSHAVRTVKGEPKNHVLKNEP